MQILLTAGPTHEPIDAVRYIANRSSGAMGLALARAARLAGHDVTLLLGPVSSIATEPDKGVAVHRFETTADLQGLLERYFPACDVLIMAAAVADFRPVRTAGDVKLPRDKAGLTLEMQATPDLVAACAARKRPDQRIIGFALEAPADLARRAREKLQRKKLDAIIANPLQTMGAADIDATVYRPDEPPVRPGAMSKPQFAQWLIDWLAAG